MHGATYGKGMLINGIKSGGHHTDSQDIHDSILVAHLHCFQCKNDVFIKMINVKNSCIYFNNSAWNKILPRPIKRGKIRGHYVCY